jgi:hypothetical protein
MEKSMADHEPTMLVIGVASDPYTMYFIDSVAITQNPMSFSVLLKRGEDYEASIYAKNGNIVLNDGDVSFVVPNTDSFSVPVTIPACSFVFELAVAFKGSLVEETAQAVKVEHASGPQWVNYLLDSVGFQPGTLDTVVISKILGTGDAIKFTVTIPLVDGGYYLGSVTTPTIMPSQNYDLVIPLVKYDPNGSLAKMTITLNAIGKMSARVTGI